MSVVVAATRSHEWMRVYHPELKRYVWTRRWQPSREISDEERARISLEHGDWYEEPDLGSYSDEDLYNSETDGYDRRKLKVECPNCAHIAAPLLSPKTNCLDAGWRWVGYDHREPFSTHRAQCVKCGTPYRFTVYTPQ